MGNLPALHRASAHGGDVPPAQRPARGPAVRAPGRRHAFRRWLTEAVPGGNLAVFSDAERPMIEAYLGTLDARTAPTVVHLAEGLRRSVLRFSRPLDSAAEIDRVAVPFAAELIARMPPRRQTRGEGATDAPSAPAEVVLAVWCIAVAMAYGAGGPPGNAEGDR